MKPKEYKDATLNVPLGVEEIGDDAFHECYTLNTINLPVGTKKLGNTLRYNNNVEQIFVPSSVTSIGRHFFTRGINYQGTPEEWAAIDMSPYGNDITQMEINYNCEVPDVWN
jgi:hypothetical protein